MSISVHDNLLVSYEVFCEHREIRLHTEFREVASVEHTDVFFTGVEAYHFEQDNYSNIILGIDEWPLSFIFTEYASLFAKGRRFGWPPKWDSSLDAMETRLAEQGVHAWVLSSSYGLSGWILAREMRMVSQSGQSA